MVTPKATKIGGVSTRQLIIQHLYETQRQSAFTRYSIPNSLINKVADTAGKTDAVIKAEDAAAVAAEKKKEAPVRVSGGTHISTVFQPNGFYFDIVVDFALGKQPHTLTPDPPLTTDERKNWGRGFGNPLVNPKKDAIYVVRAKLNQLRVDPMVGGFRLKWICPPGWLFADGRPSSLYVEASSNPIVLQRKFKSPSPTGKIPNAVFRVLVLVKFL